MVFSFYRGRGGGWRAVEVSEKPNFGVITVAINSVAISHGSGVVRAEWYETCGMCASATGV